MLNRACGCQIAPEETRIDISSMEITEGAIFSGEYFSVLGSVASGGTTEVFQELQARAFGNASNAARGINRRAFDKRRDYCSALVSG